MRLIDADALLENVKRAVYTDDLSTTIAVGICEEHIRAMPNVDAAPVKHGRWEEPEPEGIMLWDKRAYAQCSLCKKKSYLGWKDKYCRYCGSKNLEG